MLVAHGQLPQKHVPRLLTAMHMCWIEITELAGCRLRNWTTSGCATGCPDVHNLHVMRYSYPVVQSDGLTATWLYNRTV